MHTLANVAKLYGSMLKETVGVMDTHIPLFSVEQYSQYDPNDGYYTTDKDILHFVGV